MDLKGRIITKEKTILDALRKMDSIDKKLLVVLNNEQFDGLVSAGDIQRAIIQDQPLDTPIGNILRKKIRVASPGDSFESIKQMMLDFRMELCPVIDENKEILQVYFWEDIFKEQELQPKNQFDLPVVIMAGGFGTRLKPITNVIPKPLIPIGEKTMLEHIFDRFSKHGCNSFHISVNYKADLIDFYLKSKNLPYSIDYFKEDKPMGTAGSLSLLKGVINETFFVSNCDILIEQDYSEILEYHRTNNNDITIIAALKHYSIPYGTIETTHNGQLVSLLEKPELTFKINSGMYILEPDLLSEIPENEFLHITQLINKIHKKGGNVGVFPVSEKSWKDIGEWEEYLKISMV
ncbi:Nucleotidyl transferase [Cyclobacterium lianum]|uniref:Nucleotidyl transferase n=1 Tax=Cyclobacterium lianum TaxID=388280 RepID=A0A1M7NEL5_9BACT|nr:nucleotidyltransferase family protein [Cyclobacterium lianum]SHN01798.1 Nucleotidyl transferase [Cyclobacterium lianum]